MNVKVSTSVRGRPIGGPLVGAVHRELGQEIPKLGADALKHWRETTPKVTGALRRSELVRALRVDARRHALGFEVADPGRAYYKTVARRNAPLRGGAGVAKWTKERAPARIDRAITRAVESEHKA